MIQAKLFTQIHPTLLRLRIAQVWFHHRHSLLQRVHRHVLFPLHLMQLLHQQLTIYTEQVIQSVAAIITELGQHVKVKQAQCTQATIKRK